MNVGVLTDFAKCILFRAAGGTGGGQRTEWSVQTKHRENTSAAAGQHGRKRTAIKNF